MIVDFLSSAAHAALAAIEDAIASHKNWVLTAVENGRVDDAVRLTATARELDNAARAIRLAIRLKAEAA